MMNISSEISPREVCGAGSSFSAFGFLSFLMITFNLAVNIVANVNSNSNSNSNNNNQNNNNNNNNNINMNMNTGRDFQTDIKNLFWVEEDILENKDDIWSKENLKKLIDFKIDRGCPSSHRRRNFADSVFIKEEFGGDFLSASCLAVRKMMIFATKIIAGKATF